MWEDDAEDEDEDEDDEGLAGQLLSELIASNKYGTINPSCVPPLVLADILVVLSNGTCVSSCGFCMLQMMIIMRMMRKMIPIR